MAKIIPYSHQSIDEKDIREVTKVLRSDWLTQGPKIEEFEKALCKYAGAKYAVAVSSGTAGLHVASLAAGIGNGDEVITSPITFLASANCILYCGAKPVFSDTEKEIANIDPKQIEEKINKKTKAIIPVHYAGHPCRLKEVDKIAKKHNLMIIEDACHALGAEHKGTKIGSCKYSDMAVFSFHPLKSITTGEGGAVLTNNKKYYERLIMLRQHGVTRDRRRLSQGTDEKWYYEMQLLGNNYRLTDIQAALGVSQLKKLDIFIRKRRNIAKAYNRAFKEQDFFDSLNESQEKESSWHLYPITLKGRYKNKRRYLFNKLRSKGILANVHYMPVYLQPYYKQLGYKRGICPYAEDFYDRAISIPIYPSLLQNDRKYVVKTLIESLEACK